MADEPRPPTPGPMADPLPPAPRPAKAGADDGASWHRLAGIGVEFVAAVGVFAAIGWWADRKFGTSPWLLLAGCGIGFAGGLWNMVRAAQRMMR